MPRFPRHSATADHLSDAVFSAQAAKRMPAGKVYPLHVGDTYRDPPAAAQAEALRTAEHERLHNYAPVQGMPTLLDAIEERHDHQIPRDCIQVMSGATAGLSALCQTLFDPGDEVLLPSPYWPLIRGIIAARGAVPVEVPLFDRFDQRDFDLGGALEAAVSPRTVAIYVNSPNNPTGRILPDEALAVIAAVAERHDLWVIADEAYEALRFDDVAQQPIWARDDLRHRTLATHTLSKSHGLAGARVGYTHGPEGVMQAVRGVQAFHTYCSSRPMQLAAARALREGDPWLAEARESYHEAAQLVASSIGVPTPESGTFLFFDASRFFGPGEQLAGLLARCLEAGVLMTPGAACGKDYGDWIRLCYTSVPPDELSDALSRLATVLR